MNSLEVYMSTSLIPYDNLALENYLLNSDLREDEYILFFWINDRSVIIGRNQNPYAECDLEYLREKEILLARRITGGGAVYHDLGNLNISIVTAKSNFDKSVFTEIVQYALRDLGINAEITGRNDIEVDGHKVYGCATHYGDRNSLYHGCVLVSADLDNLSSALRADESKLTSKEISSVKSRVENLDNIIKGISIKQVSDAIELKLYDTLRVKTGTRKKRDCAELYRDSEIKGQINKYRSMFSSSDWIYGKKEPCGIKLKQRFNWGSITLIISLEGDVVDDVKIYTDSLETEVFEQIENGIRGRKYEKQELTEVINNLGSKIRDKNCNVIIEDVSNFFKEVIP